MRPELRTRSLIIITIFVFGTTGAVMLVAGAASSNPIVAIEDPDPPMVPSDQLNAAEQFTHVKGFLDAIPDASDLLSSPEGCPLPLAEDVLLRRYKRGERVVGRLIEVLRRGQIVGVFPSWMELIPLDASHFAIHRAWHGSDVALVIVSIQRLDVLTGDLTERIDAVSNGEQLFLFAEGSYFEMQIPRNLEPGDHAVATGDWTREVAEVLLLYPSTREEACNRTHVMRVEPWRGVVNVVAPVGNAFREFDATEAHVRLIREPRTGRPVGDGPKIRPFVLGAELSRVEKWLD
jgi:hypothetical protein